MYKLIFLLGIVLFSNTSFSQKVDENFHIYLLMGQSNMAGRGKITKEYKDLRHDKVVMLDSNFKWLEGKHPVHFDKPKAAGVGPGLSFGIAMADANQSVKIGLVPCAVGGTSIDKWKEGAYDKATNTYPYDDAVKRIKEAMKYGVVKGIIWHQGESNSSENGSREYLSKLSDLISNLRTLVGNNNLPFVVGELGTYKSNYSLINNVIQKLPKEVANTAIVSSEGFTHNGDGTHFDSASADEFGKRFAKKIIALQTKSKRK